MKILIVDDEPELVELLAEYLKGEGHQARGAGTVGEALKALAQFQPELILLDQLLPDQKGSQALADLRSAAPGAEVVIITGQAYVEGAVEAMQLGAQDYLSKPLDLERLKLILSRTPSTLPSQGRLEAVERKVILQALQETQGHRSKAADKLGISRKTLFNKLRLWEKMGPRP